MGAFRYILKTDLTKTNLINVLKALLETISEEPVLNIEDGKIHDDWAEYLEKSILPFLLGGNIKRTASKMPDMPPFGQETFSAVCGDCRVSLLLPPAINVFPKTLKSILKETFEKAVSGCAYYNEHFIFVSLVPHEDGESEGRLFSLSQRIVKNISQYYSVHLFAGISAKDGAYQETEKLIFEANEARKSLFFSQKCFVQYFNASMAAKAQKNKTPLVSKNSLLFMTRALKKRFWIIYKVYSAIYGMLKTKLG